ncbi:hypothetical protein [Sulfitobacter sp. 1A12779]|uniref:hypothetical protein n=1 Tax=Sulfitobacter sp. 1A12779 TaxID=3368599 RepID=UPI00374564E9
MTDIVFGAICAAGAFFIFALLWGIVEVMVGTGTSRQKRDSTLNAFQQPLRQDD